MHLNPHYTHEMPSGLLHCRCAQIGEDHVGASDVVRSLFSVALRLIEVAQIVIGLG